MKTKVDETQEKAILLFYYSTIRLRLPSDEVEETEEDGSGPDPRGSYSTIPLYCYDHPPTTRLKQLMKTEVDQTHAAAFLLFYHTATTTLRRDRSN